MSENNEDSILSGLKSSVDALLKETATNHRIIIVALAVMAAGKELLAVLK